MWKYKAHKNAIWGIDNNIIPEENVIYIDFNTWYYSFQQDRENWSYIINDNGSSFSKYILPIYFLTGDRHTFPYSVFYIKFFSKKEYKQFIKMTKTWEIKSIEQLAIYDELVKRCKKRQKLQECIKNNIQKKKGI